MSLRRIDPLGIKHGLQAFWQEYGGWCVQKVS
jgi:hypothetical protein